MDPFSHLLVAKLYLCLKRPKINTKEVVDGLFKTMLLGREDDGLVVNMLATLLYQSEFKSSYFSVTLAATKSTSLSDR